MTPRFSTFGLAIVAIALVVWAGAVAQGGNTAEARSVEGEVLVRFVDPAPLPTIALVTTHLGLFREAQEIDYKGEPDLWRLRFSGDQQASSALKSLRTDSLVEQAQPNYIYSRAAEPNDTLYSGQQRPYMAAINAPAAWQIGSGSSDVMVGIVDSGVDIHHPELASHIWINSADPPNGVDDDLNGCTDDTNGCSFQSNPPNGDVGDLDGHGTFGAGIIAAEANNGIGISGVAPGTTIMPIRALDSTGDGTTEQLASAIEYAAAEGADVINLSVALDVDLPTCPGDPLVAAALAVAHDMYGATIVAATGNQGLSCVKYPGSSPLAIGVGASGPSERPDIRAHFSNYGPEVDVVAPGVSIASTCPIPTQVPTGYCPGPEYGTGSGTSFSAPMVAGVAALLLAHEPSLTNDEVAARLRDTAHDLPDDQHPNWDGSGRVDVARAMGAPAGFARVDVSAPEGMMLRLTIQASGTAGECEAGIWDQPVLAQEVLLDVLLRPGISGTFGVAECSQLWPPGPSAQWNLDVTSGGGKAAVLNGWSASFAGQSCSATGLPLAIAAGTNVISPLDCTGATNDTVEGATVVDPAELPLRFQQDLRYAMIDNDDPAPSCLTAAPPGGFAFTRSIWYRVSPSGAPSALVADAFGSEVDVIPTAVTSKTVLVAYRDGPTGLEEVACNVAFPSAVKGTESRIVWRTDGLSTYYLMAAADQTIPMGVLRLNISPAHPPPNDSREAGPAPISLADAYPIVEPAHSATRDATDPTPSCANVYGYSLWFKITEAAGQQLAFATSGSDYDTVVAVFRKESAGTFTEIACNDEETAGVHTSRVNWQSDGGEYLVMVDSYPGFAGGVLRADLSPH